MNSRRKFVFLAALLVTFSIPSIAFAQHYTQTNLVTDAATTATALNIDPNLKNPWGITRSTTSPFWVGDNNAGISTLYNGAGTPQALVVKIPGPNGSPANFVSAPTGVVFNGAAGAFELTPGNAATAAKFMFVTEDGTISAWAGGAAATLEVDNSANPTVADGAVYKGATIAEYKGNFYLYVANFRSGHVEVYDTNFNRVTLFNDDDDHHHDWSDDRHHDHFGDRFEDDQIPRGYAPFNVQNIGESLFVTYAKQDQSKHDDLAGTGFGFVDIYSPGGRLESRLQPGPWFNAPWGAVWTPRDFGAFSNRVLIGNFGSGKIAVFDGFDGNFIGFMEDPNSNPIVIDGLWSLIFGNSALGCPSVPPTAPAADVPASGPLPKCGAAGPYNSLFFTAGPNGEANGLIGTLTPIAAELGGDFE
jgi:uncharacterized protein (TIGR03118 family)